MGGLTKNSWLGNSGIGAATISISSSPWRAMSLFLRAMPTSAGTLYIRSAICGQKTLFLGKVYYRLLYSLALDIEYDTQLHFQSSDIGILVGVRRVNCVLRVIEIPL
jgi:hypothetical protein